MRNQIRKIDVLKKEEDKEEEDAENDEEDDYEEDYEDEEFSDGDLNTVSPGELAKAKQEMDVDFERIVSRRVTPGTSMMFVRILSRMKAITVGISTVEEAK